LLQTDEYYAQVYGIPMVAGQFYGSPGAITDSFAVVINQTEANSLGWTDPRDAVGKQLKFTGDPRIYTIAGVTKDFHFSSMQEATQPVIFVHVGVATTYRFLSFKLKPGNIAGSIETLQKQWRTLMPGAPFEFTFMDEVLKNLYKTEIQLKQASYVATVLALVIVLLGVIGLIALSIQKRAKEIGIRKVLGSSVAGIIALFMSEFLVVILIAGTIACPIAYFLMQNWLSEYAYRVTITAQPFIISVLSLGFITALLIALQTIKAANANPVQSLRTE